MAKEKFVYEYSLKEVAKIIGITQHEVEALQKEALIKIKIALEKKGVEFDFIECLG